MEPFKIDDTTLNKLKEDSNFLRNAAIKGNISSLFTLNKIYSKRILEIYNSSDGFGMTIKVNEINNLITSLDAGYYYITPDVFSGSSINYLYFIKDDKLESGEFKVGNIGKHHDLYDENMLVTSLGYENYQDLVKALDSSIKGVVDTFSNIRVFDFGDSKIPYKLSSEVKTKIKQIYKECIKDYFNAGELDPEISSLKDIIADIFKKRQNLIRDYGLEGLPDDLMTRVIRSLVDDEEKEVLVKIESLLKFSKAKENIFKLYR